MEGSIATVESDKPPRKRLPLGVWLQYGYLLRAPILVGVTLFALPIVALFVYRQLLGNLFLLGPWNILWTMIATTTLAFSILVVFRVVLLNGKERFGIQQALTEDVVSHRALLLTELLTVPMLIAIVFSNGQAQNGVALRMGAAVAGIVAVHVVGYGALWLTVLLSPRYHIPAQNRYPVHFTFLRRLAGLGLPSRCCFHRDTSKTRRVGQELAWGIARRIFRSG